MLIVLFKKVSGRIIEFPSMSIEWIFIQLIPKGMKGLIERQLSDFNYALFFTNCS